MSIGEIKLCCSILKEYHGIVAEKVSACLLSDGSQTLKTIAEKCSLKLDQTKRALYTLLQHHLVEYEETKRGPLEYSVTPAAVMCRFRFARYIYCAKLLYGDAAELLVEELLQHGEQETEKLKTRVAERLRDSAEEGAATGNTVGEQFVKLVKTHFIRRCPAVDPPSADQPKSHVPVFVVNDLDTYALPPDTGGRKRKRSAGDSGVQAGKRKRPGENTNDQPTKKQRTEDQTDDAILWRVNCLRFDRCIRDQLIVNAVCARIDKGASVVMRTMLRLCEDASDEPVASTHPISYHEIAKALPQETGITKEILDQYLKVLVDDSMQFVFTAGDSGGGRYVVHFQKALKSICESHIESVIQERFGSKCFRIFKLLLMKQQLEQKQIEELAMIPPKEAKEILYRMFGEQFVMITELPKTPDHAPSRTFYLFSVNINQVARMLLERSYKAMYNLILRRENEMKENRRLLDKQQRVEAIVASLDDGEAASAQRAEIEELLTPAEREQLSRVKHVTNKLEQSELQLEETMFVLQTFLVYSVLK